MCVLSVSVKKPRTRKYKQVLFCLKKSLIIFTEYVNC